MTIETEVVSKDEIKQQLINEETLMEPSLETRLDDLLGGVQALWHVAKEVDEDMTKAALMFIHEALFEHVRAIRAGLYKCEKPVANVFSIACPTMYHG
ncbi:MAG: hypothetical protein JSR99_08320 [Proteobacteria bacterium]|nr:hypothetical protein [Pseudomonadota bacterium]